MIHSHKTWHGMVIDMLGETFSPAILDFHSECCALTMLCPPTTLDDVLVSDFIIVDRWKPVMISFFISVLPM
jgi:hypothetical protein